eukprot:2532352-Pleurochrysis_carterae.AAC.1
MYCQSRHLAYPKCCTSSTWHGLSLRRDRIRLLSVGPWDARDLLRQQRYHIHCAPTLDGDVASCALALMLRRCVENYSRQVRPSPPFGNGSVS